MLLNAAFLEGIRGFLYRAASLYICVLQGNKGQCLQKGNLKESLNEFSGMRTPVADNLLPFCFPVSQQSVWSELYMHISTQLWIAEQASMRTIHHAAVTIPGLFKSGDG